MDCSQPYWAEPTVVAAGGSFAVNMCTDHAELAYHRLDKLENCKPLLAPLYRLSNKFEGGAAADAVSADPIWNTVAYF